MTIDLETPCATHKGRPFHKTEDTRHLLMKFSSQEEYGLRCLLQIAKQPAATIPSISRAEGITEAYVAKLLAVLRKEGFITSTRGQAGGYALARKPDDIIVGQVLNALGGKLYQDDFCDKHKGQHAVCNHTEGCSIKPLWDTVQRAVDQVLDNVTLGQMLGTTASIQLLETPPQRVRVNA